VSTDTVEWKFFLSTRIDLVDFSETDRLRLREKADNRGSGATHSKRMGFLINIESF